MKKIILLSTLFVVALLFNLNAQNLEKEIIGKWKTIDVKVVDEKGKPLKLTADLKKELAQAKEMFAGKDALVFEFKDGKMNAVPAEGEGQPYKINGNFLDIEASGETPATHSPITIVKGILEMAPLPAEGGKMMVLVMKKQK